jgi:hypothetical protein
MKFLLIELAKLLLKMAMDKALRKALPKVYALLDGDLPQVLSMKPAPMVVESVVAQSIAQATGNRATVDQIQAVIGLYDPMKAALRNIKK